MNPVALALENQLILRNVLQILFQDRNYDCRRVCRLWRDTSYLVDVALKINIPKDLPEYLHRFPNTTSISCPASRSEGDYFFPMKDQSVMTKMGIDVLANYTHLQHLELAYCPVDMKENLRACLRYMVHLKSLSFVQLDASMFASIMPAVECLPNLDALTWISSSSKPVQCAPLTGVSRIRNLRITQHGLLNAEGRLMFPSLANLTSLHIEQAFPSSSSFQHKVLEKIRIYEENLRFLTVNATSQREKLSIQLNKSLWQFLALESLSLSNMNCSSTDSCLFNSIASLQNLRALSVHKFLMHETFSMTKLTALTHLTFLSAQDIYSQSGSKLVADVVCSSIAPCEKLRKLLFMGLSKFPSNLCFLFTLTELSLSFNSVNSRILRKGLRSLKQVKKLTLKCSMYVNSKSLKHLRKLSAFSLDCMCTDIDLISTLESLPCLTDLCLKGSQNLSDDSLIELSFVSKLVSLSLHKLPNTTRCGYLKLFTGSLVNLKYLNLDMPGLSHQELLSFRHNFPNLFKLNLSEGHSSVSLI